MTNFNMGNSDNVILNDMDESIGYYKDLYASLAEVAIDALKEGDAETAYEQVGYLVEMQDWQDHEGLLVLSMNNGMGFTCKPYEEESGENDDLNDLKEEIVGYIGELLDNQTSKEDYEKAEKRVMRLIPKLVEADNKYDVKSYTELYNMLTKEMC